jgi:hypothetical protein
MPKGLPTHGPRSTEQVARESLTSIFLEALHLMKSDDPGAWETLGFRLDEAADMARTTEKALAKRAGDAAAKAFPSAPAQASLPQKIADILARLNHGPHKVLGVVILDTAAESLRIEGRR